MQFVLRTAARITAVLPPLLLLATIASASTQTPRDAVKGAIDQTISILHSQQMPIQERRRQMKQLADANLDLPRMTQEALGDHWSELTPDQRARVVPLFAAFIETAYLAKIQDYAKLNIDVTTSSLSDLDHARVNATVNQPDEGPTPIAFLLEKQRDKWIVYDVDVGPISMVGNYRSQFDHVIRSGGIEQLMDKLKEKQAQLARLLGESSP